MPKEFNPDAIDLNVRYGSVRKESLDPEMFPFDWFEFESPPTAAPTYDKHRLKLKDFAVLQATLEGPAFIGLDCAEDVNALDVVALDAAGDVIKADKSSANTANVIGFAATTTSSGDKVRVITGGVLDGFSGLTPNDVLYLDTSGGYTQDFGDLSTGDYVVALGVAVSESEVRISITQPLLYEKYDGPTYAELQDGYNESGGTTTPSQVMISRCEGYYKAIVLQWDCQLNLTNFDHYEIQVSEDNSTWYSLQSDGSDWKDQLGSTTDVDGEFFVHSDIPHAGTEEDPVGRRLYYRIRRVTKAPVQGEWSSSASATTLTVETGDLAKNSVLANTIQAGVISAREMAFGTDENSIAVFGDDELADVGAELFDLSQPDCVGSKGTRPEAGKEIVYAPGVAVDETGREYPGFHSPRMIGQSEAIFQASTNLVKSPEDLTTADWTLGGAPTQLLTDQYVDGKRLTKIGNTGAALDYVSQIYTPAFSQTTIAGSYIVRKGSTTNNCTLFRCRDQTAGTVIFGLVVDFDNYPNSPGTPTSGILHDYTWIDANTVQIWFIAELAAAGNDANIRCYASSSAVDKEYTYYTAIQLEDLPYPTPYIDRYRWPTGVRPAVSPNYAVTMPEKFVFKVKLRPWFTYDTTGYHRVFEWYEDANSLFLLYYHPSVDKFYIIWKDNGTSRYLISEQFDDGSSHDDINSEIILFGAIDLSIQTGNNRFFAIVAGSKQAEDNNWGGTPDTKTTTFTPLYIGNVAGGSHADSLIEYAKFWEWDGSDLGTLDDETDIDRVTADLTSLFDLELEDYSNARYKPVSKQGAIGIFQKTTNLVDFPEDLTDASWLDENGNITPSLSDYYIDGKRFTKLLVTDANTAFTYKDVEVTTATPSFQAIFEYGLVNGNTRIQIDERGVAARGKILIDWANHSITLADGATNLRYVWITDKKVWVAATAAGVVTTNDVEVRIFPDTSEAANDYIYVTAVMVEDVAYPTPYTPTERAKDGILNYPFEMPEKFTLMFWVRPWFTYTSNLQRMFQWYIDSTHFCQMWWDVGTHKFLFNWRDGGGNSRQLYSQEFDDGSAHDDLNQWIFVALAFDPEAGQTGSRLRVYADTIEEDTDFGAAPDAKTSTFPTLSIGHDCGGSQADSFISDLLILPNQLLTAEQMDRHYWKTRPWHSPGEVASFDKSVRIDRSGIRLHNAELNITDWRNRQILISNRDGLMAKDAAGKVIHDIPDMPILVDRWYCGHLNFFEGLSTNYLILADTSAEYQTWTDVTCVTDGNSNVKAGLFRVNFSVGQGNLTQIFGSVFLRPKGSSWSTSASSACPLLTHNVSVSGAYVTHIQGIGMLICPIGDNNQIQYYFDYSGGGSNETLYLTQLGVFI